MDIWCIEHQRPDN